MNPEKTIEYTITTYNDALTQAVERNAEEKDISHYLNYPLNKVSSAVRVLMAYIACLETTIDYVESICGNCCPLIYDYGTAIIIDEICDDFGVETNAATYFQIQEMNEKANSLYPYLNGQALYSEEFSKKLTYDEYVEALGSKYIPSTRISKNELAAVLEKMKEKYIKLKAICKYVFEDISRRSCWQGEIATGGIVFIKEGTFYEELSIGRSSPFIFIPSEEQMERCLLFMRDKISIKAMDSKKPDWFIYCDSNYYNKEILSKAIFVLDKVFTIPMYKYEEYLSVVKEWKEKCKRNELLQQFIKKHTNI